MSKGISCILLLIHIISIVNGGITKALEGDNITLSCKVTGSDIEDKTNINALWKKETGQRVIWKYSGEKKIADTFLSRKIDISGDFSLIINECNQTDQGVYILYINRKQSCKVRLLVTENTRCRRSTDKLCSDAKSSIDAKSSSEAKSSSDATQDLTNKNNPNKNQANQRKGHLAIVGAVLFLGAICSLVVLHIKRKNTTKNDKSEQVLNPPCTVIQIS